MGKVCYLIVSIPDLCTLAYFDLLYNCLSLNAIIFMLSFFFRRHGIANGNDDVPPIPYALYDERIVNYVMKRPLDIVMQAVVLFVT